jgi:phosphate-selective porin OprO/OprP
MSIIQIEIHKSKSNRPLRSLRDRAALGAVLRLAGALAVAAACATSLPCRCSADEPTPAPPAGPVQVSLGSDGLVVQSQDGSERFRLAGLLQADGRFYSADVERLAADSFLLRSARPILQGTVARRFDFLLQPDFGQGQPSIQDAYLDARFSPALRLQLGKFKTPFGLERLQPEAWTLFTERALPNDLVPNRDVGLELHGELEGGVLAYQAALTNGVVDGGSVDLATNDAKDVSLRAFVQPFRRAGGPLRQLGLGLAATFGRQQGLLLPVYRTTGQVIFFNYTRETSANGNRSRLSPQASFFAGPLEVIAEYVRSTQAVRSEEAAGDATSRAWQVAAGWMLTGETASAGPRTPRRSFDPGRGGFGALELVARVHALSVGEDVFRLGFADPAHSAQKAAAWGVGLNWYLTRNVKYAADFERTRFEGGAPEGNRPAEKVFFVRAQIAF